MPFALLVAVMAMPRPGPSASVTLSKPPPPAISTSEETSVPTAPDGAGASSLTAATMGESVASRTGAPFTVSTLIVSVELAVSPSLSVKV